MLHFNFPEVGETITEGTIVKWLVKEGDTVKNDQVLAEIETDKAVVEIPSPRAGVVLKLHGKENETIKVGAPLVTIGDAGEKYEPPKSESQKAPQRGVGVIGTLEVSEDVMKSPKKSAQKTSTASAGNLVTMPTKAANVLPRTRILAEQLNVDLATVQGTGSDGRITDEDVKKAAQNKTQASVSQSQKPAQVLKLFGPAERIPFKGLRKTIAQNIAQSLYTAPHVTMMDNADVTELSKRREQEKKEMEKQGVKLTLLPYILKACVAALQEFPMVNSSIDEVSQEIVLKKYYNIGFAVDTEDGLLVPVLRDVDKKSVFDLAREMAELAEKARTRKIQPTEMEGNTFSVTNYGSFGGMYATPVIYYPDAAILGIGRMKEMPTVMPDGKIEARKILPLSLAFDHRIFDGALAAKFLNAIIKKLES